MSLADKKKNKLVGVHKKSESLSCSTDDDDETTTNKDDVKRKTSMGRLFKSSSKSSESSGTASTNDHEHLREATTTSSSLKKKWSSSPSTTKKKLLEEELVHLEQEFLLSANERLNTHEKRITMLEIRIKKDDALIEDLLSYTRELQTRVAQLEQANSEGVCSFFDWF